MFAPLPSSIQCPHSRIPHSRVEASILNPPFSILHSGPTLIPEFALPFDTFLQSAESMHTAAGHNDLGRAGALVELADRVGEGTGGIDDALWFGEGRGRGG